jgi:hypothetical protein
MKVYLINDFLDHFICCVCGLLVAYQCHYPFSSPWLSLTVILYLKEKNRTKIRKELAVDKVIDCCGAANDSSCQITASIEQRTPQ